MSKSLGSIIRIEAISVDLASAMEKNHPEDCKCEHFCIRGYATEMRKKDASLCLPFAFNGNHKNLVVLPRLHDTKSKWWGDVEEEKKDEAEHATIIDRLGSQSSGLGTLICAEDGNKRIESMVCDASKIASTINKEKKEHDNLLFENDELLAKNSHHDQGYVNNLSGLIHQKTRKVRSLNELLEDHSTRTETGPSSVMPCISAGSYSICLLLDHMVAK
ncbi:hypothetical protein LOK49_LG11G01664 [Camellia lanceoleosa]|uniref:Uncharacterized protein n=1 Tax=Camellia lanceoleosa TaxID=1840588 RepID=A0ACC0G5W1_9ERIC|nr:hypothetical protein LOK49_LG11G01664 [Camellia lanceoleosa]